MKVQLALLLVSLLVAGCAAASPMELHANLLSRANKLMEDFPPPSTLPTDLSPACQAAFQTFGTTMQTCGTFLANSLSFGEESNTTVAQLDALCNSNCVDVFKAAIAALFGSCDIGVLDGQMEQALSAFTSVIRLTCLKFEGQYCFLNFTQSMGAFAEHVGEDFTVADLKIICSPCTALYFKAVSELGNLTGTGELPTNPLLDVVCTKNGDEFCYPKFQNFSHLIQESGQGQGGNGNGNGNLPFEYMCDRCIQKAMARFDQAQDGALGEVLNQTQAICVRDGQNRLCPQLVAEPYAIVREFCDPSVLQGGNCSQECAHGLHDLITLGGCCAGNVFAQAAQQFHISPTILITAFKVACQITLDVSAPCGPRTANVALSLRNLKYEYYLAHRSEIDPRVINDVATQAGVPPSAVTITGHASQSANKFATMGMRLLAASGTTITTTITSTDDVSAISQDLTNAQASGTLSFPSLAALPAAASVDPTASAGATAGPGQSTSTSAASLVQPTAILALLIALVLFA